MVKQKLTEMFLYRWRYVLGYGLFAIILALLLWLAGLYIPGGLPSSEIHSALISDGLNPAHLFSLAPQELLFLPYRLLQAASIAVFGFSSVSIKLPSLILAFFSALGILYLVNLWFKRNVAVIACLIAVTTTQFLLAAQSGQPGISYIFLTVWILVAASLIAQRGALAHIWVIGGFILAGIGLYLPLNIYVLIALIITALIHPHARHTLLHKASRPILAIGGILFLVIISPLIIGTINTSDLLLQLLGIPHDWGVVGENAKILLSQYASFAAPSNADVVLPAYGFGTFLLIMLGLYRMFTTKYTTKSYIISFWLIFLLPLVFLNPSYINITFIPVILLVALGIDYLIWSWYRLFPKNPYARVFGLVPLAVLVIGLVGSGIDHYAYGYHYDHSVYTQYNFDLGLLSKKLRTLDPNATVHLVVKESDQPLYRAFATHQRNIKRLTVSSEVSTTGSDITIIERGLHTSVAKAPADILIAKTTEAGDRFYLYKNPTR
ncbi:hypothetical protein RAAC3_TM7C00001G0717 [Candidatus Saccharibacteria bacterium RAAC3_TM7_1]|nr:hypothetical protein RAAC3_TM7C00001G0717 [Candidatus Saccharibacteria bacterium RAAC3_TM7_1]HCZ28572.1 hypothetical protein [Candidatus Saccharibacteria bacterium]